jgi:hypothetical protein
MLGGEQHGVEQPPVHPEPHADAAALRLQVDVRRPLAQRVVQQHVRQPLRRLQRARGRDGPGQLVGQPAGEMGPRRPELIDGLLG